MSALLIVALAPLLRHLHIPVAFDWERLLSLYWVVLAAQSIFVAALLFLLGTPKAQGLGPLVERLRQQKLRIIFVLVYFLILLWAFTWLKALILTVDAIALLEYLERTKQAKRPTKLIDVLAPGLYLFIGFLLVFAYNDVIVSVRFYAANDPAFNRIDRWILHGTSVAQISHWAFNIFPYSVFRFLEFIYFGMFPQVGAGLLISSLYYGKQRGMQFAGAIVIAYYLALTLFYIWPSQGPYWICAAQFSTIPYKLETLAVQKQLLTNALALWNHTPPARISTDYFIAFPCMHITQPLIVMWFLRPWKRVITVLAVYDLILAIAILFLEWHYLIDILASFPLAALAIFSVDGRAMGRWLTRHGRFSDPELETILD